MSIQKTLILLFSIYTYTFCLAQPSIHQMREYQIKETNRRPIQKDGKWGFVNHRTEQIIVPCIYDTVQLYRRGYAKVQLNEKWGLVTMDGKQVVAPIYTDIEPFIKGYTTIRNDEKVGIIDTLNRVIIPIKYSFISSLEDDYFRVYFGEKLDSVGVFNTKGRIIIPFGNYISISTIQDGTSIVGNKIQKEYHKMNNMAYGKIDIKKNKKIIPITYRNLSPMHNETKFYIASNDRGHYGFFDKNALINNNGKILTAFKFYGFERFHFLSKGERLKTKCFVSYLKTDKGLLKGLIDEKGNEIFSSKYRDIDHLINDFLKLSNLKTYIYN